MKKINPNTNEFFIAEDYANAASADNTKLAYAKDIDRFTAWGGKIPTDAEQVSAYIAEHATTHKPATLSRWIAAISVAHQKAGFDSPTHGIVVRHTLRGVKRKVGTKQRRVEPLTLEMATAIVDKLPDSIAGKRDKAIVLIGFSAAMRRSEVTRLSVSDLTDDVRGMVLDFGKSKTNQEGGHSEVAIPKAKNPKYCPILALKDWMSIAKISDGPIFRSVNRYGDIGGDALSTQAIANIVKKLVRSIGLDPTNYSGHSLRSGLVTSAVKAKKPLHKIREITRHASDSMLEIYIRDAEQFEDNASDLF